MGITAFPFSSVIDVPTARILGRDDAGTGSVEALTNTEIFAILGTGTPSASTYLRGDGTWSAVSAGVGGSTGSVDNAVLRADGTGGATLQASAVVIPDNFTASPNATVNHASIQATGATTNVSVSVVPKGTGSFSLQVPNGATSGGNARGANAVDLQTDRSAAAQVASGQYSFTICYGNTASGTASFAGGFAVTSSGFGSFAWGNANTISGQYATGFGQNLTVSATHAFGAGLNQSNSHVSAATLGSYSASLSVGGVFFGTSGRYSNPTAGDMHAGLIPLVGFTQGATAVNLGHGDSGATRLSVPSGSSFGFSALIHGVRSKGGEAALFHRQGIVKNIGGSTSLTGSIQTIGTDINAG